MSEDLIRRSDAIKVLEPFERNVDMMIDWFAKTYVKEVINGIRDGINNIEPKRGEWAKRTHNTLIAQVNFAYCSECGQPIMHEHTRPLWNFCPNCGARMKGADDE